MYTILLKYCKVEFEDFVIWEFEIITENIKK